MLDRIGVEEEASRINGDVILPRKPKPLYNCFAHVATSYLPHDIEHRRTWNSLGH
jgi:hypothetical protein